jgi:hypothetical protein
MNIQNQVDWKDTPQTMLTRKKILNHQNINIPSNINTQNNLTSPKNNNTSGNIERTKKYEASSDSCNK